MFVCGLAIVGRPVMAVCTCIVAVVGIPVVDAVRAVVRR